MMRRHILHYGPLCVLLCLLFVLAGCGAMPGNTVGGSGTGADAGPWPNAPSRSAGTQPGDNVPNAPVLVVLRATAAKDQEMRFAVSGVQLKSGGAWLSLAKDTDIKANYAQPIRAGDKGGAALLAKNTQVPKRKYSHFQVLLDDKNTVLVTPNGKLPLTLQNTVFELHDWLPDEKKPWNVLVITVDGTKVIQNADSATLPANAIAFHMEDATGAITGKLIPISPTAHVEAVWSGSKIALSSDTPSAQDGTFTLKNLPDGAYTLAFNTPGYHLVEPLKEDIVVSKSKAIKLTDISLTPDNTAH